MENGNAIQFEKPDLMALTEKHTVVDMHYHTRYSDGDNTIEEIANRARELGIGVAITDHNAIQGAVELEAYKELLSIPGIEITSLEGTHILIYFYDIENLKAFYHNDVEPNMGNNVMSSISLSIEDIICRAKAYEALIIFPHPYSAAYVGICNFYFQENRLDRIFDMVDGVEVLNSENLNKWNLKSAVLGFNLAKGITGGSDGHKLDHMGNAVSYAPCPKDRKAFLDAIKQGQNKVMGKEMGTLRRVISNSIKLKVNIRNYPNILEKSIKYSHAVISSKIKKLRNSIKNHIMGTPNKRVPIWFLLNSRMLMNHNLVFIFILTMPV